MRVGPLPIEIPANGIVAPEAVVTVRTRVDGQIEAVHVTEGQMVRRGDRLFTLDARSNQALLAQQEAQLARDRAQLARTQADATRYLSLRGEGFAAQQRFEQAQADAQAAAAVARATEALLTQTRLQIEFATITAEADGRLGTLPQRVGNFVRQAENTTIATITQIDPIMVTFSVPERWLAEIQGAMRRGTPPTIRVRPQADDGPPIEGPLVFIDSAVDTQTGTIALKGRVANGQGRLWPGQFVGVVLTPRIEQDVTTVPSAAVQTGQNGRFVFVLQDGVARRRGVEVLRASGDRTVVRGQIAANDRVIVDGAQRVTDGMAAQERGGRPAATPQRVSSAN
ncbi:efflux RND transporter periplasmic adaptor subunit [Roseomonas sp. CCTCC AB2023176]|uniref:efflux RND transporter periplasmic adaptor subunit n=1 Tax=Roseomonas sp. CCTCC AB2023176 TaxID=3342640 RepID=UPI0035DCC65E